VNSFVSERYDDIYFNLQDPEAEKDFVFLCGNDLYRRLALQPQCLVVAELGFGYGLNCALLLAAAREARYSGSLHFYSVEEKLPTEEQARALLPKLSKSANAYASLWQHRHALSRGERVDIFGVCVTVFPGDVNEFMSRAEFLADAWFFDGFSPAKNSAMWSDAVFAAAFARTRAQGTFATYSSAGWVRRNLLAAGYTVSRVPGFSGKREMLTGKKEKDAPA